MAFESVAYGLACFWIPQTNMTIVAACGKLTLHSFPFDAKHPALMTSKYVRRCFREQVP